MRLLSTLAISALAASLVACGPITYLPDNGSYPNGSTGYYDTGVPAGGPAHITPAPAPYNGGGNVTPPAPIPHGNVTPPVPPPVPSGHGNATPPVPPPGPSANASQIHGNVTPPPPPAPHSNATPPPPPAKMALNGKLSAVKKKTDDDNSSK